MAGESQAVYHLDSHLGQWFVSAVAVSSTSDGRVYAVIRRDIADVEQDGMYLVVSSSLEAIYSYIRAWSCVRHMRVDVMCVGPRSIPHGVASCVHRIGFVVRRPSSISPEPRSSNSTRRAGLTTLKPGTENTHTQHLETFRVGYLSKQQCDLIRLTSTSSSHCTHTHNGRKRRKRIQLLTHNLLAHGQVGSD